MIAANEGGAVALAAGHYLATGTSGARLHAELRTGQRVNPLSRSPTPTCPDPDGAPRRLARRTGHARRAAAREARQGHPGSVRALGVPHAVLPDDAEGARAVRGPGRDTACASSGPFALVVPAGTFAATRAGTRTSTAYELDREGALKLVLRALEASTVMVGTTGKTVA